MTDELTDAALDFLKRTRVDRVLAPYSMSATLFSLINRLANRVAVVPPGEDLDAFIDDMIGLQLNALTLREVLGELQALGAPGTEFRSTPADPEHDRVWYVRNRVAAVLGDVYRDLLLRLLAADPTRSPQPQETPS